MDLQHTPGPAPLTASRSKRSSTNLANLRLAPLSTKFEPPRDRQRTGSKSPHDETRHFARHHSSYLQGKSAPTTPGILSRSSSRRHLTGGISRRGSLYENEGITYEYAVAVSGERPEIGSGQIPKAMSEAALNASHQPGVQAPVPPGRKRQHFRRGTGGSITPRVKSRTKLAEDDWLTRTGVATNAVLQESKGQSWLASKESSTSITGAPDTTDDEDEGYEEMAVLSSIATRFKTPTRDASPVSVRASKWGSRYGSRPTSRRTSRRGSMTGSRTPLAATTGPEAMTSYFDPGPNGLDQGPVFDDADESESANEEELVRLASNHGPYGLTGFIERIMTFGLFNVSEEQDESSVEEDPKPPGETKAEAKARMLAEARRKKEAKDRLVALPAPIDEAEGQEQNDVGWQDAAWLLSVATRAIFSDDTAR